MRGSFRIFEGVDAKRTKKKKKKKKDIFQKRKRIKEEEKKKGREMYELSFVTYPSERMLSWGHLKMIEVQYLRERQCMKMRER